MATNLPPNNNDNHEPPLAKELAGWALYADPEHPKTKKFVSSIVKDSKGFDKVLESDLPMGKELGLDSGFKLIAEKVKGTGFSVVADALWKTAREHVTTAVEGVVGAALGNRVSDPTARRAIASTITSVGGVVVTSLPQIGKAKEAMNIHAYAWKNLHEAVSPVVDRQGFMGPSHGGNEMVMVAENQLNAWRNNRLKAQAVSVAPNVIMQTWDGVADVVQHGQNKKINAKQEAIDNLLPKAPDPNQGTTLPAHYQAGFHALTGDSAKQAEFAKLALEKEALITARDNGAINKVNAIASGEFGRQAIGDVASTIATTIASPRTLVYGTVSAAIKMVDVNSADAAADQLNSPNALKMVLQLKEEMYKHFSKPGQDKDFTTIRGLDGKTVSVEEYIVTTFQTHQENMGRNSLMDGDGVREFAKKAAVELTKGNFDPVALVDAIGKPGVLVEHGDRFKADAIETVLDNIVAKHGRGTRIAQPQVEAQQEAPIKGIPDLKSLGISGGSSHVNPSRDEPEKEHGEHLGAHTARVAAERGNTTELVNHR